MRSSSRWETAANVATMHTGCGSSNPIDGKQLSNGQGAAARRTWPARLPLTRDRHQPPQAPHTPHRTTADRPPGRHRPRRDVRGRPHGCGRRAALPSVAPGERRHRRPGDRGDGTVVALDDRDPAGVRARRRRLAGEVIAATPARLGWSGLYLAAERRQGTGKTPAGTFAIPRAFGRLADPGTELPYRQFDRDDAWTYDPDRPATYNVFQTSRAGWAGYGGSAEHLWSYGRQYNYVAVMDYNLPGGPITTGADGVRRAARAGQHQGGRRHLPARHERQGHGRLHRHPAAADARRAALARSGPQAGHRRRARVRHHPHVAPSSVASRRDSPKAGAPAPRSTRWCRPVSRS